MELFTSFEGRIRRGQWWIGVIVLVIAVLILQVIVGALFGAGFFGRFVTLLVSLAALYPALALATKRLADRGHPPMPRLALFYGPGVLLTLLDTFRIGYRPLGDTGMPMMQVEGMPGPDTMMPGTLPMVVGFIALIAGLWALVELGILKGDEKENAFGPPPA